MSTRGARSWLAPAVAALRRPFVNGTRHEARRIGPRGSLTDKVPSPKDVAVHWISLVGGRQHVENLCNEHDTLYRYRDSAPV